MSIGYVYKITSLDDLNKGVYIGSTFNIKQRKNAHRNCSRNIKSKRYNYKLYDWIRVSGGWSFMKMDIVVKVIVDTRKELVKIERNYMDLNKGFLLNTVIPFRSKKEYNEDNKKHLEMKQVINKIKHRTNILKRRAISYKKNRTRDLKYANDYYKKNRDSIIKKRNTKFFCMCGQEISVYNRKRHFFNKSHQKNMVVINQKILLNPFQCPVVLKD